MAEKPSVDFTDKKYQRESWKGLENAISQNLKRLNTTNIKEVIISLFKLDLLRGRGLFTRLIMKEQEKNLNLNVLYTALVAVINSKIPEVGKLLICRLVVKYKMTLKRNDTKSCQASIEFIGQLVNFNILTPLLALQILVELLNEPTPINIEFAYALINTCGRFLLAEQPDSVDKIYQKLRILLSEGLVSKKGQLLIQKCMQIRKLEFETNEEIPAELDLVENDDIITHTISLNENIDTEDKLDTFNFDPDLESHFNEFIKLKTEILGDNDEEDDEANELKNENNETTDQEILKPSIEILDLSESKLLNFQKTVYLTIMSSLGPEEATHKLMKVAPIDPSRKEYMLVDMILKCCTQEKTYSKYYGLIGEELIVKKGKWPNAFNSVFKDTYENCAKFDTTLLRNIGKFWGHMFASDKMGWEVLSCVTLTEQDTTSSGRIFLKFLFQRMLEELGVNNLVTRLNEEYIQEHLSGIFPHENAEDLRFSINFFTAIGLGKLTDRMRNSLQSLPSQFIDVEEERGRSRDLSRSRSRSRSYSGSSSRTRSGSYSRSRSPSPSRGGTRSDSIYRERLPSGPRNTLPIGPRGNTRYQKRYDDTLADRHNYRGRDNLRGRRNYGGNYRGNYRGRGGYHTKNERDSYGRN